MTQNEWARQHQIWHISNISKNRIICVNNGKESFIAIFKKDQIRLQILKFLDWTEVQPCASCFYVFKCWNNILIIEISLFVWDWNAVAQWEWLVTFLLRSAVLEILSGVTPRSDRTLAIPRASTPQLGATFFSHRLCTFILHTASQQQQKNRLI